MQSELTANIYAYQPDYYYATEDFPNTIRMHFRLTQPIDGEALREAVQITARRFPYFLVRLVDDGRCIRQVPNDRPIVVREGFAPVSLGTEETNRHLLLLSYEGNDLLFDISHFLTDGAGLAPFWKSFLYDYLCRVTGEALDPTGFEPADAPFYPDELGDPYDPELLAQATESSYEAKKAPFLALENVEPGWGKTIYEVEVAEAPFVAYAKQNGGSPNIALSVLLSRILRARYPENPNDVLCGIAVNYRPFIGNMHSYRMLSSRFLVRYPKAAEDQPFAALCAMGRNELAQQKQPENIYFHEKMMRGLSAKIAAMPTTAMKRKAFGVSAKFPASSSFDLSYVAKLGLGSIEPYIESLYNTVNGMTGLSVLIEAVCINGNFNLSFNQTFEDDFLVQGLIRSLNEAGIPCALRGKHKLESAGLDLDLIEKE